MMWGGKMSEIVKCNFCGKASDDVEYVILGYDACICDECVKTCYDLLLEQEISLKQDEARQQVIKHLKIGIMRLIKDAINQGRFYVILFNVSNLHEIEPWLENLGYKVEYDSNFNSITIKW